MVRNRLMKLSEAFWIRLLYDFEFIIIDDCSTDRTSEIVMQL